MMASFFFTQEKPSHFCKGGRQTIAMKRKICLEQLLQGGGDVERSSCKRGQRGTEAAQGEGEVVGAGPRLYAAGDG